jgi:putative two-component system response regulator
MATIADLKIYGGKYSVLLVEDEARLRATIGQVLNMLFKTVDTAGNGREGLDLYRKSKHHVIITDIDMPVMNGVDMMKEIKKISPRQPAIVISGHEEAHYLIELINLGVHHFIPKPFEVNKLFAVLEVVLRYMQLQELERDYQRQLEEAVALRTEELRESLNLVKELSEEIVLRLTNAAEYRDTHTGAHINRMAKYVDLFARALAIDDKFMEALRFSAPLHDIGKIGIPDDILLKTSGLSESEWVTMKTHTIIGARILDNSKYDRVNMACSVAMNHHEHWDGTGYPRGLEGEAIPFEGRIIAVCDVYDALRSDRPYKNAVNHEEACLRILEGDERTHPSHFDPRVLSVFRDVCGEIEEIYKQITDVLA